MAEAARDYTIQALGLKKSRVFHILNTLEQHQCVQRDAETVQYRQSPWLGEMG